MPESEKNEDTPLNPPYKEVGEKTGFDFNAYRLVFEVGYMVAIPLVLFALGGRYLDNKLGTAPWLLLTGIVVSIFITSFIVYKKVKKIL